MQSNLEDVKHLLWEKLIDFLNKFGDKNDKTITTDQFHEALETTLGDSEEGEKLLKFFVSNLFRESKNEKGGINYCAIVLFFTYRDLDLALKIFLRYF